MIGEGEPVGVRNGPDGGGSGIGGADPGERGLNDEESGADEDTDQNEEEALLPEEVVDGSGEGSAVLHRFRGVRWGLTTHQR